MRLRFSKLLEKLVVKYVPPNTKDTLKNRKISEGLINDVYAMFLWSFSDFLIEAYVVGTHLNCIKLMQFKWVPTTSAFIKK